MGTDSGKKQGMKEIVPREYEEENQPDIGRRELLTLSLLGGATYLATRSDMISSAHAEPTGPASPQTTPFVDELFIPPVLQPTTLFPAPDRCPVTGEAKRNCHQGWNDYPPEKQYLLRARETKWQFHSELPPADAWGFEGLYGAPIIDARYGEPITVRYQNELPSDHQSFGIPEISIHLHNAHTPWESDGHASEFYESGLFKDHHYPNIYAGGDYREALGSLWFHDHRHGFTGANVYRGLHGHYRLFDELDSGDENDPNPEALRLPSGDYDVPLAISDKIIQSDGQLYFDPLNHDGFIGDKFAINGIIQPHFNVARRKYRFRLLNASASRVYQLFLASGDLRYQSRGEGFSAIMIATDGNLLPAPVEMESVRISPAERVDLVIDFSRFNIGDRIYLVNRLRQDSEKRARDRMRDWNESDWIMEFRVDRDAEDPSRVPERLRELPPIDPAEVVRERVFNFERTSGSWAINDKFYDPHNPIAEVKQGTAEIWTLRNNSGGWSHPLHIHLEEHRILELNGRKPTNPQLQGRKDVIELGPNDEVKLFMRFRTWTGRYLLHCHNTPHEDHAMMARWDLLTSPPQEQVSIERAECKEDDGNGIDLRVRGTTSSAGGEVRIEDAETGEVFGHAAVEASDNGGEFDFRLSDDPNYVSCPERVRVVYVDADATAIVEQN